MSNCTIIIAVHGFKAVVNRLPPAGHYANPIVSPVSGGGAFGSRTHYGHRRPGFFSFRL